jgi:hypothetical protein
MAKQFKLKPEDIKPLATGLGACIASDRITVEGQRVGFMYRAREPDTDGDSGWRFLAGTEDQAYMDDASNHGVYDVNTIANCDPSIVPLLKSPPGSVFERPPGRRKFEPVDDWEPGED